MSQPNPFNFHDYKDFLKEKVAMNRGENAYQSRLAEAAGCQKSFLSQVLNSHVHVTPDHAAAMSGFLGLTEEEQIYFIDLVAMARCGSPSLREVLKKRMKQMKDARADPSQRIHWPELEFKVQELYYSSWHWGAIHMLVSIPNFRTSSSIAERLGLPRAKVEKALEGLEAMKLIEKTKGGWKVTDNFTYLPNSSPMTGANHINWRQRAIANIQSMDDTALHYSAAFALSQDDFHELKEMIVEFIEQANNKISASPCEEAAVFSCDFFRLG